MKRIAALQFFIPLFFVLLALSIGCGPAETHRDDTPAKTSDRPDDSAPTISGTNPPQRISHPAPKTGGRAIGNSSPAPVRALTPEEERAAGEIRKRAAQSTEALNQQVEAMQKAADERDAKLRDPKQRMNVLFDEMTRQVRHLIRSGQGPAALKMLGEMEGLPLTGQQLDTVGQLKREATAASTTEGTDPGDVRE